MTRADALLADAGERDARLRGSVEHSRADGHGAVGRAAGRAGGREQRTHAADARGRRWRRTATTLANMRATLVGGAREGVGRLRGRQRGAKRAQHVLAERRSRVRRLRRERRRLEHLRERRADAGERPTEHRAPRRDEAAERPGVGVLGAGRARERARRPRRRRARRLRTTARARRSRCCRRSAR